ncbi:MAG: hypothetical protein KC912_25805 [Proteobacteria bacterium]|nr:hypothetical protein [Pseudomonadota bacterium]
MLDDLKPLTLGAAARHIGVDPFEVVRLLVLRGESASLRIPRSQIEALREFAGVELWWTPEAPRVEDDNPKRGRVRSSLAMLLERGHVGEEMTRVDNLWRGLPVRDQEIHDEAVNLLAEAGILRLQSTVQGLKVAVADRDKLQVLIDGGEFPEAIAKYWE